MAHVELKGIAHSYQSSPASPEDYALHTSDLVWEDGGAYALLGPSGSGKTTLLNIISGLVHPSEGKILFDGRDITGLSTSQRNIAQVFQFPVIYDTMTVFDNLAFPLRNRGVPESKVRERVMQVAELLELTDNLKRRASGLAVDAKQKISLGRGLVRNDVAALLFDEPLTVIDPHVKWKLRLKLKQIRQEFKSTLIYVTHDQAEALTFADQVMVLREGRVVQTGSPTDLFERPAHTFVGHFIGSPGMNLLPCVIDTAGVRVDGHSIPLDPAYIARARSVDGELELGIRPEFVRYEPQMMADYLPVEVTEVEDLGNYRIVTTRLGKQLVKVKVGENVSVATGPGWLSFPPEWTYLYIDGDVLR
ncbi:MAG TPA: ABC transporter ATP-binding protein [Gammaproteobacteria bacterium]|nr:ABC transporter ATP-binding protein [Gammaproteobacteria bacterium]